MAEDLSGIYQIQSKIKPNRIYIGSAVNLRVRKNLHIHQLRQNKHGNRKLQWHFNKYGENDFIFSILITCDKKELIECEQFFIDALNPYFNLCKIAGSALGIKRTPETTEKWKKKMKGRPSPKKGKKYSYSEETIKKWSIAALGNKNMLGHKHSKETKRKMSEKRKGKPSNRKGVKLTDETKNKMKESQSKRYNKV